MQLILEFCSDIINAFSHRGFLFTISFNIIRGCQSYSSLQKDEADSSVVLPNDTAVRCRGQWYHFLLFFVTLQHSPFVKKLHEVLYCVSRLSRYFGKPCGRNCRN